VRAVVEERDADAGQRDIREVAVSTYVFDGTGLVEALRSIDDENEQKEFYLTDAVAGFAAAGGVAAVIAADVDEVQGINTHEQRAAVEAGLRVRINRALMESGVWMQDPSRTYVDAGVAVAAGTRLYAGTHLEGATTVAAGAEVGPDTFVRDSSIGEGARVWFSVLRGAEVGAGAEVGPYASLRPGTVMGESTKAGTFVELKQTVLAAGAKVPHLSYMGDAAIGEQSNIGAGTITCNYDGHAKHRTVIGDRAFIGSDTMLVAPVEIGDDAYTGAGSVITKDVSPGALGVERSAQKEVPGYAARRARLAESEGE
jgi:bifunctional UDP-N-acetylglucosamine pyrophosphorylase/glucosamine-1-phosphate N-acetyltransferase